MQKFSQIVLLFFVMIIGSHEGYAQSSQEQAIQYAQNGEFERAAELFLKEYNDAVHAQDTLRIIRASRFLGNVFSLVEDPINSLKYYEIAVSLAEKSNDDYVYFMSLMGLTYYYASTEEPKLTIKYSEIAIDLIEKDENEQIRKDTLVKGSAYANMGVAFGILNDYNTALEYYLISVDYYLSLGEPIAELSTVYRNIGYCYTELGEPKKGLEYLHKALEIAVGFNRISDIRFSLDMLYKWHKKEGNNNRALEYLEKYTQLKDTMLNASVIRSIEDMNTRYESDRLKGEISQLNVVNKKHTDRIENISLWIGILIAALALIGFTFVIFILRQRYKSRNRKLAFERDQAELKQRVLTAQMNPHFLFNSLNSIQRMYLEGNTTEASDFMADFGSLLRKVLQYSEMERISLQEDLEVLQMYLGLEKRRSDTDFQFEIVMDPAIDPTFLRVPPMIVQPFLENAIWHGILPMKEKGWIRLKYTLRESYLECEVVDNGIGYENSQNERKQTHISKGVRITKDRLASLPDALSIQQMGDRGTQVIIKIPLTA